MVQQQSRLEAGDSSLVTGQLMGQARLRPGESCWASLGCDAIRAQGRDGGPGWAGWVEFGPWPIENWKKFFNFQILFKF
jgi:hypothetical protein